jgi:hypothetical protein
VDWTNSVRYPEGQWWHSFLFATESRPALGHAELPMLWVPGAISFWIAKKLSRAGSWYRYKATGWTIRIPGFDYRQELGIFLFSTVFRPNLGTIQPLQWVPGALPLGVKRPRRGAERLLPSSAEVKNSWGSISNPPYVIMASCLIKRGDNFTFTFTLPYQGLYSVYLADKAAGAWSWPLNSI